MTLGLAVIATGRSSRRPRPAGVTSIRSAPDARADRGRDPAGERSRSSRQRTKDGASARSPYRAGGVQAARLDRSVTIARAGRREASGPCFARLRVQASSPASRYIRSTRARVEHRPLRRAGRRAARRLQADRQRGHAGQRDVGQRRQRDARPTPVAGMTPSERGGWPSGSIHSSSDLPGGTGAPPTVLTVRMRSSRAIVAISAGLASGPASTTTIGCSARRPLASAAPRRAPAPPRSPPARSRARSRAATTTAPARGRGRAASRPKRARSGARRAAAA